MRTNYKVVLVGDAGVGKSSLVEKFALGTFKENRCPTIGAAFFTKDVVLDEESNDSAYFQIWDTAGQEKYRSLVPIYYRGAHIAILVYDVTDTLSFEHIEDWLMSLENFKGTVVLVGNKNDMIEQKKVLRSDGESIAKSNNMMFYEISAKESYNETIDKLFIDAIKRVPSELIDNRYRIADVIDIAEDSLRPSRTFPHTFSRRCC